MDTLNRYEAYDEMRRILGDEQARVISKFIIWVQGLSREERTAFMEYVRRDLAENPTSAALVKPSSA